MKYFLYQFCADTEKGIQVHKFRKTGKKSIDRNVYIQKMLCFVRSFNVMNYLRCRLPLTFPWSEETGCTLRRASGEAKRNL
jgi:hypothetical protein